MATMLASAPAPALATGATPFSRILKVEFRKSYNTRSSFWLLASIGGLVFIADLIAAIVTGVKHTDGVDWSTFASVAGYVTGLLLPVLGIMLVTSEWSQRTAMTTFALEPRRARVILAKLVVGVLLAVATVAFALVVGAVFNLLYGAISGTISWSFSGWDVLTFGSIQVLSMVSGFALAALFLNTPAAIVVYFAYKFLLPTLFAILSALMNWFDKLSSWIDFQAAQTAFFDRPVAGSDWGHVLVSGLIWLVVPLVIGLRRIMRAEVK